MGWVRDASGGSGRGGVFFAIGKESSYFPAKGIIQHELSHCYGASDHGWSIFDYCVMSYFWLWFGVDQWCSSCRNTINNHIWQE
jgi:hypothetical protein